MVRVMLVAVVLQGLAGILMAVLYARRRNALPAFAVAVYNGGIIAGALALHGVLGVYALVVGVVLGAAGQVALQLPGLGRVRLRPSLDLNRPEVRAIFRLYLPVVAGMVVTIFGIVIDRNLASQLAEGSLSVMNYATRLIQFPLGLVGTAASFAVLAPLARHASALAARGPDADPAATLDDRRAYRDTLLFGTRLVLLLMLPAMVGLMVLAEPVVRLLFEYGRFGEGETARTARVFVAYAPQLPFTALDQVFIVAFYARKDTRTPVLVGVATVFLYLGAALLLIGPLDVAGLALANAIQNSAHGLILLALLERAGVGVLTPELGRFLVRVVLATATMGGVLWLAAGMLVPVAGGGVALMGAVLLLGALAGATYVAALELLGVRDARAVAATLLARTRGRTVTP
jgi:putative peptidoglycan lipid II flippase